MDRGARGATVHGGAKAGHDLATKPPLPPQEQRQSLGANNLEGGNTDLSGGQRLQTKPQKSQQKSFKKREFIIKKKNTVQIKIQATVRKTQTESKTSTESDP